MPPIERRAAIELLPDLRDDAQDGEALGARPLKLPSMEKQLPSGRTTTTPVRDVVVERVERTKGRISAKRLLPVAQAAGYTGSARNFRRLVAEVKAEWRAAESPRPTSWGVDSGRHVGL